MIRYIKGNLLESDAQALVNTVNTVGIMGKGIALQFKTQFPNNFKIYATACKEKTFSIGQLLVTEDMSLLHGNKVIINFPTKTDWRKPSEYGYIEHGLQELIKIIREKQIHSVAIPPLGTGNGGLNWVKVKAILEKYLSEVDCEIQIYQPDSEVREILKKERVHLTPARAMLLAVLYDLVRNGEFVSEFASEKVRYFLQRFGAKDIFKLDFQPNFYGPYSGKVKHVLYYLNGSYISGYSTKDKKPFEELCLIMDAEKEVSAFWEAEEHSQYRDIVQKTKDFLSGFYSSFALELLSTIDFIAQKENTGDRKIIKARLENWSNRKRTLFSDNRFLEKGIRKLEMAELIKY